MESTRSDAVCWRATLAATAVAAHVQLAAPQAGRAIRRQAPIQAPAHRTSPAFRATGAPAQRKRRAAASRAAHKAPRPARVRPQHLCCCCCCCCCCRCSYLLSHRSTQWSVRAVDRAAAERWAPPVARDAAPHCAVEGAVRLLCRGATARVDDVCWQSPTYANKHKHTHNISINKTNTQQRRENDNQA